MPERHLVVYDDVEVLGKATAALQGCFPQAEILKELNLHDGLARIRYGTPLSLVVVGALIRKDAETRPTPGDFGPIGDFVRACIREFPDLPLLVLSPTSDPGLAGLLSAHDNTVLVETLQDWREEVARRSSDLVRHRVPRDQTLELVINLFENNYGTWQLACRGPVPSKTKVGLLKFKGATLKSAARITDELEQDINRNRSLGALDRLGGALEKLFFTDAQVNRKLWSTLTSLLAKVGGMQNTRVMFTTFPNDMAKVPLEALKDSMNPAFWMLQAPIVRQYDTADDRKLLFEDPASPQGPINCLVISADPREGDITDGKKGWSGKVEYLGMQKHHAKRLQGMLESFRLKDPRSIGRVDLLQLKAEEDPVNAVFTALDEGHWHLVHFVGHAVIGTSGQGGLVLAATPGNVLPFSAFAEKLGKTQFLFVSSCRSATSGFFEHAARNNVPAVLGFRWLVGDFSAYSYARDFYQALFTPGRSYKSLDYAFLEARQAMHRRRPDESNWTAPVLYTQLRGALH